MVSSACFEHPSVHPQEDLYMQFYGQPHPAIDQTAYIDTWKKYQYNRLPDDEHLDVRNMSKTL
jgi:hypothetical protein